MVCGLRFCGFGGGLCRIGIVDFACRYVGVGILTLCCELWVFVANSCELSVCCALLLLLDVLYLGDFGVTY